MNTIKNLEKLIKNFCRTKKSTVTTSDEMDKRILNDALTVYEESQTSNPAEHQPLIRRIIMKSTITKLAAAAVIIFAILIGINKYFGSIRTGSVAFGDVLGYIQKRSYTFDLTLGMAAEKTKEEDLQEFTIEAMVWELGKMRVDCSAGPGVGKITSITDFNAGKTLLLFHHNQTGVIKEEPFLNKNTAGSGVLYFCTRPIENLWNVRDGTEQRLGKKEIDGQKVTGFRVLQEDRHFEYDITIWADSKSGVPVLVEEQSYPSIKLTMKNFDLDVELDEELFSLDLPEGYTLAYQEDLEELQVKTEQSAEAKKIVRMLELWSEDKKDEAIKLLLQIDWTKKIEFGKEPYIFSLTEKGYVSLKAEDQTNVIEKIMATASEMRKLANEVVDSGKTAVSSQEYEEAEKYFNAALQLGKLLDQNPDSMLIAHLVGIAIEKIALNEMISLYKTTNNHKELKKAQQRLSTVQKEIEKIKEQARAKGQ